MNLLTGLLMLLGAAILLLFFAVMVIFVVAGAVKLYKSRAALKAIDLSDGIDAGELELIKNALLKSKAKADEEAAKVKLQAASEKLAEVAKT